MAIPDACLPLAKQLDQLQKTDAALRRVLNDSRPPLVGDERAGIARQIDEVERQITAMTAQLNQCVVEHGRHLPYPVTFTGTATLTTTLKDAPGPFRTAITMVLRVDDANDQVLVTAFPSISTGPIEDGIGETITLVGVGGPGFGTYSGGLINITLVFLFHPSTIIPRLVEDADFTVELRCVDNRPIDVAGNLALVGSGPFAGGAPLSGNAGTLELDGVLKPVPFDRQ